MWCLVVSSLLPLLLPIYSYPNPHDADNYVHASAFAALVLVAPHAIFLVVPVGASGGVHAASASRPRRFFDLAFEARWGGAGVLNDGGIDHVLKWGCCVFGIRGRGGGFFDQVAQDLGL